MKLWLRAIAAGWIAVSAISAAAADVNQLVARAQASAREGKPSAQADLAGLIEALRAARGSTEQTKLIDAIATLGDAQGASPAAVKAYLRDMAPTALLELARSGAEWTVRGEAFTCLRTLDASDAVLDQAIAIADADSSPQRGFIRSRGALLRSWKDSRVGGVSGAGVAKPADEGAEQRALAFLRPKNIGVSYDSLQRAIAEGDAVTVEALIDAGVSVGVADAARANGVVINGLSIACGAKPIATERIVQTIDVLAKRGFGLRYVDASGNTLILSAAQFCPGAVVGRLVDLGAEVNPVNKQNFTPLEMAFVSGRWDTAKVLIDRGARLSKQQLDQVFFELPQDPVQRGLVARATQ
jgi:hypothetical protein